MRSTKFSPIVAGVFVLLLAGCASDPGPTDLAFVHDNSCGRSFTVVNEAGTAQLSLRPLRDSDSDDIPAGVVEIADETWAGSLKVGSGLGVWPCHDIATDFEEVEVDSIWVATSGTIEIAQLLPATAETGGGGARGIFTIIATDVVLSYGSETIDIPEVTLTTPAWGFYGG